MATTVARLEAILSAKTADFDRSMARSETRMNKAGHAAGVMGAVLAGALAIGAKHAIDSASDLHEQVNKTEVVFRKNGKSVVEWSKHLANSFGLSDRAALQYAATFGNMLKPMGISIKRTTQMSKSLTQLAGDMASFNNASIEDTLHAIQSGLANQVRPLRRYGVFLDQDRIKLEAVSLGLVHAQIETGKLQLERVKLNEATQKAGEALAKYGKGSKEYIAASATLAYEEEKVNKLLEGKVPKLTSAQKAQAAYSLIVRDTADAHGDFTRTAGGLANQERILQAQFDNLSAQLGTALLPAMTSVMGVVIKMTTYFSEHTKQTKILAGALVALTAALLAARAAQILMNLAVLANPYVAAAVSLAVLTAAVVHFYKQGGTARVVTLALLAVFTGLLIPTLILLVTHWNSVKNAANAAWDAIRSAPARAIDKVLGVIQAAVASLRTELHTLGNILDKIIGGFKWLIDNAKKIGGVWGAITGAVGYAKSKLTGDANNIASAIMQAKAGGSGATEGRQFNVGRQLWDEIGYGERLGLRVTSGYRPGARTKRGPSDHSYNPSRAVDMSGSANAMAQMFMWLIGRKEIAQAFYDPLGSIFNGQLSSYREGGHSDHIHIAEYDKGGWLKPGLTLAMNNTGRPEPVGGNIIIPVSLGGQNVGTVVFDMLRRKATVYERQNGRTAFGGI